MTPNDHTTVLMSSNEQSGLFEKTQLLMVREDSTTQRFTIEQSEVIIGRSSDADIMIDNDSVSRYHAKIVSTREGFSIQDLGSTNGTFVLDQRVVDSFPLSDGVRFNLGNVLFHFFIARNNIFDLWPTAEHWDERDQVLMDNVLDLAEKYLHEPEFSIEHIASDLYMSSRQLQRRVKSICGDTPSQLMTLLKMRRAKVMLQSNAPIEKVAEECGFSCGKSLSRAFKKHFHYLPSELQSKKS
ncbi:helix-turn-helix domain-containing protein [Pleionea sp. CnH1-48]|uniref:helix-turn-helix domain-containing protein n=1 Tax=Pleionea sp. CnH1-48 TaxID=2954494 RepID=UPI002096D778|nr:helix-turn-helix domain-containing protein [Pleionea sp. CnH1-48]MCO7222910.1 helix-turn-helix domain-containing protein [Pleionea sp. CnH1-48]